MDDAELHAAGINILGIAYHLGHIPEEIYSRQKLLSEWWVTLGDAPKKRLMTDFYCWMQMNERRPWWKFWVSWELPRIPEELLNDDQLLHEWWLHQDERPWWKKRLGLLP